jgi:flavin reductase (DIM6/NTAB) family NADH-FMN oxidoreductase RutF
MRLLKPDELMMRPFHLLDKEWALLVGGSRGANPMTVSWGGFGTLWNLPVVTVYVRPTRYTYSRLSEHPEFTLNILPEAYKPALELCGTQSGRDVDKWAAARLTQAPSERVAVPRVGEANLAFECRTLATVDLEPGHFLDSSILGHYPQRDYHRAFIGEVLAVWATDSYPERG